MAVPRLVLVSGSGGAGRTTLAAATAALAAESGERVLLVAADDPFRGLDALLDQRLGAEPTRTALSPGLSALRLDEESAFRAAGTRLMERAKPLFDLLGVEPLAADELTALPGARELALLDLLRSLPGTDAHDLVVVDAPPVAELLTALALPARLDAYLARLLPDERQAARALRPVLAGLAGVPMPSQWLFEARAWVAAELAEVRAALDAPGTTVRLVVPSPRGPRDRARLRRMRAALALEQLPLESVLVRGAPGDEARATEGWVVEGGAVEGWAVEGLAVEGWAEQGGPPVHLVPDLGREPERSDLAALAAPAALATWPEGPVSAARKATAWGVEDRLGTPDGVLVWHLPLPGAERADLDLLRRGDDLLLGVAGHRRTVPLPSALRRCTVAGAALRDGELTVRFAPDPSLWPVPLR